MRAAALARLKPGWYLLIALLVYAVVVSVLLARASGRAQAAEALAAAASSAAAAREASDPLPSAASPGLWFPIPGARLPASDDNLPGAPRAYRHGVSQGFDFYDGDAGVPVSYGTPVVAAADGQVVRADLGYTEMDPRAWEVLMADVSEAGADEEQLDRLRGRQVWIRTQDGTVLRYGHLASVRSGLRTGSNVYRGQVIGYVGNSGTDRAVAGGQDGARLRFEIWEEGGDFFGAGLDATAVRLAASALFVGP